MRTTARRLLSVLTAIAAAGLSAGAASGQDGNRPAEVPQVVERYADHAIAVVNVQTQERLDDLLTNAIVLDCRPGLGETLVVLTNDKLAELRGDGLPVNVLEPDAQAWIDRERDANEQARRARGGFFTAFRSTDEISQLVDDLVALNPQIATRVSVGQSLGDQPRGLPPREIFGIRITAPSEPGDPAKPVVVVNGCQHAREWGSPMGVSYLADALVRRYGSDTRITELVDAVEFHVIPVVNPDGYEYTRDPAGDRFWRKNRRQNSGFNSGTVGVDLNRNWPIGFANGASNTSSGSSDVYHGTSAFSEPETQALRDYIESLAGAVTCIDGCGSGCCGDGESTSRVKGHIDVHTFSQVILGPWSFTSSLTPPRAEELTIVQSNMSDAMTAVDGMFYQAALGDMPILYEAGGVMPDWAFGAVGALSWTYELRPSSGGLQGFVLPVDEIDEAGEEVLAGVLELAEHVTRRLTIQPLLAPDAFVAADAPVDISVEVIGFNGLSVDPMSVALLSRSAPGDAFTATPLVGQPDGTFAATIVAPECGDVLEYRFSASDNEGVERIVPPMSEPAFTSEARVTSLAFTDSLDDAFPPAAQPGWTVGASTDTATTGIWEVGNPTQTTLNGQILEPEDDNSEPGDNAWITELSGGSSVGTTDIDGGATTLISPVFDLSSADAAQISYARWFSNNDNPGTDFDTFTVDITPDNGGTWVRLERLTDADAQARGGWFEVTQSVSDPALLTDQVRVRFVASDGGVPSVVEAGLDDFAVTLAEQCPTPTNTCAADFNDDGVVDGADFGAFGAAFGSSTGDASYDEAADFNDDGVIDGADFGAFGAQFGRSDCLE